MKLPDQLRVLIIEDNPGDVRLLKEALSEYATDHAFTIEIADRLSTACKRLEQGGIDVILLDLLLPDSERLDTLRAVQKCAPKVPIIILSILTDEQTAIDAVAMGAQEYLFKGQMDGGALWRTIHYAIARKKLEGALRESEERFRLAAENYPSIFVIYSADRRIEFINEIGARVIGRSKEELRGLRDEDFVPNDILNRYKPVLLKAMEGRAPQTTELSLTTSQGELTYILTYVPVLDELGKLRQLAAFTYDITDRKRVEDALRESEARYRRLSESLEETVRKKLEELRHMETLASIGQMVSVVAHEVRNPLQNIRMGVDAIRMVSDADPEKQEILGEIEHGVNLLNTTVNELLEYAKPLEMRKSLWAVGEICQQALRGLAHRLDKLSVECETPKKEDAILVDGPKIIRVLMNLITNAVEAMPEGGKLKIRADFKNQETGEFLTISVSDAGPGIPQEHLPRVQDPFFTTKMHGTGLGLAICRKIVAAHGGALKITSKLNQGTTVEVLIPISVPENQHVRPEETPA